MRTRARAERKCDGNAELQGDRRDAAAAFPLSARCILREGVRETRGDRDRPCVSSGVVRDRPPPPAACELSCLRHALMNERVQVLLLHPLKVRFKVG